MKIIIGYLYSDLMNIYGDTGNIIALQKRAQWRGIEAEVINISLGAKLNHPPSGMKPDIYFFGGGQDQAQELVAQDLIRSDKGKVIKSEVERGVPLLSICGGYQLLGDYYQPARNASASVAGRPHEGPKLPGVRLFPAYTIAGDKRMIGNIVIKMSTDYSLPSTAEVVRRKSEDFLVGFENHSGKTYLKEGAQPLGKVIKGFGNNGDLPAMQDGNALQTGDKSEGCIYKNAIGCYMHGSLLPKNPALTDWLLQKALEVKYKKDIILEPLDDEFENKAHEKAVKKFS